ncbi:MULTISPECIES: AraC family transcriptional regulator [Bradyrhizobium]|uniref:AraC family transcriptional regulator n=1 Tax=Bradyrhizobium TaxID=374 RepID=UPI00040F9F15|nr:MULTISPECIES: AraC family transcriptional regulator [Bradyrhizobium]MBO4223844.1 helix-turn-helix domain-containing protein [Bradyrhizobium neotropicale]RZN33988.1 AraC family transcriptional regulator [Bradyrhizobium sp. Leo121]
MSTALRIAHGAFGRVALLDMDRSLVRHAHPHCHVLLKVEGADTQFLVGDRVYPLTDTCAVLVDGWKPHAYVHDPARPRTLILALYIEPEWLKEFRPGWAASGAPGFFDQPSGEVSPRIRQLTMHLATDMMSHPDCVRAHEQTLSDLMIAVIERFTPWRSFPNSIRGMNAMSCDWRIRRATEVIRAQEGAHANVDQFAKGAGLSRAQFFRLFESSLGVSPKIYLNVVRMERALDAVIHQDTSVTDLSERFGFPEPAHFTRFFRDHAGVGPREFRNVSRLAS